MRMGASKTSAVGPSRRAMASACACALYVVRLVVCRGLSDRRGAGGATPCAVCRLMCAVWICVVFVVFGDRSHCATRLAERLRATRLRGRCAAPDSETVRSAARRAARVVRSNLIYLLYTDSLSLYCVHILLLLVLFLSIRH